MAKLKIRQLNLSQAGSITIGPQSIPPVAIVNGQVQTRSTHKVGKVSYYSGTATNGATINVGSTAVLVPTMDVGGVGITWNDVNGNRPKEYKQNFEPESNMEYLEHYRIRTVAKLKAHIEELFAKQNTIVDFDIAKTSKGITVFWAKNDKLHKYSIEASVLYVIKYEQIINLVQQIKDTL